MTTSRTPQAGLEDQILDDAALEGMLDHWWRTDIERKALVKEVKKARTPIDEAIKDWPDGEVRIGPYVVTVAHSNERDVDFHVESKRLTRLKRPTVKD